MIEYLTSLDDLQATILAIGGIVLIMAILALIADKYEDWKNNK